MGRNMQHLMSFALKYPGWHSYQKDRPTVSALRSLVSRGLIRVNEYNHFQLAIPEQYRIESVHLLGVNLNHPNN